MSLSENGVPNNFRAYQFDGCHHVHVKWALQILNCVSFSDRPLWYHAIDGSPSCNPEWFPAIYSNRLVISTPLKNISQLQ